MRTRKATDFCGLAAILSVLMSAAPFTAYGQGQSTPAQKAPDAKPAATAAAAKLCPSPPPCGTHCSNYPFHPTDCWTTKHGPAKADVVDSPTNLLYCNNNTYALCPFSGPPTATGKSSSNTPLPCVVKGSVASCTCQAYTSGANFVAITAILNRGAYFQTVSICGQDGSKCQNIANCGKDGKLPGCENHPQAPVCQYVKDQSPSNPQGSLMPKADLISTFSFAMSGPDGGYSLGSTSCNRGRYSGCMTAPCFRKKGQTSPVTDGELVQCECPIYDGIYQVSQKCQDCLITGDGNASYVWSASNTVKPGSWQ